MPGVTITISDTGLTAKLTTLEQGLRDLGPLYREIGEIALASVRENFEGGGRPRWQPLSPVTLEMRRQSRAGTRRGKVAVSNKILFVSGTLASLSYKVLSDGVQLGTHPAASAYAAIQQFGGLAGRNRKVRIPARPYLLLQDEDIAEIKKAGRDYLRGLAGGENG